MVMSSALQTDHILYALFKKHLIENNVTKYEELNVYSSNSTFEDVFLYDNIDLVINFSGLEFHKDWLRLKFYVFNNTDYKTNIYVRGLTINEKLITRIKSLGKLNGCGFDYFYVDIYGNQDLDFKKIYMIDFEL